MGARLIEVRGRVETDEGVTHVIAAHLVDATERAQPAVGGPAAARARAWRPRGPAWSAARATMATARAGRTRELPPWPPARRADHSQVARFPLAAQRQGHDRRRKTCRVRAGVRTDQPGARPVDAVRHGPGDVARRTLGSGGPGRRATGLHRLVAARRARSRHPGRGFSGGFSRARDRRSTLPRLARRAGATLCASPRRRRHEARSQALSAPVPRRRVRGPEQSQGARIHRRAVCRRSSIRIARSCRSSCCWRSSPW